VDPLTYFDVVEELARVESATAWSVLISTSTMTGTVRALTDEQLRAMFTSPRRAIMAGSAPPKGRALPAPGGYRLTGRWSQGSNVLIAGWLHLGRHLYDGDTPRPGPDGRPAYRYCVVPISRVDVLDTWHTTGMRGTGSHDYTVTDVFIPDEHVHPAVERSEFRPQPLYQFDGWTHVAHAAVGLGIARVAVEEFVGLAGGKEATWLPGEGRLAGRLLLGLDPGSPTI
jgi:alkylation response protein AidB-like acyl-CoA dehydrogenase